MPSRLRLLPMAGVRLRGETEAVVSLRGSEAEPPVERWEAAERLRQEEAPRAEVRPRVVLARRQGRAEKRTQEGRRPEEPAAHWVSCRLLTAVYRRISVCASSVVTMDARR